MATKKDTPQQDDESSLDHASEITSRIDVRLAQLGGICAVLNVAELDEQAICSRQDLRNAIWCVRDLIESVQTDFAEFHKIFHERVKVAEVARG